MKNFEELFIFESTVKDGNMSYKYDNECEVSKNIASFFYNIGLSNKKIYRLSIDNKDIISELTKHKNDNFVNADAVIIKDHNIFVYLSFGDCIPMVVYDPTKGVIGFAHLGWQSICLKLHNKLLLEMCLKHKSQIKDLYVYLGPSISYESYAFHNPAQLTMKEWEFFIKKNHDTGMYNIDLVGFVCNDILSLGILDTKITKSEVDTATDPNYFSHYSCMRDNKIKEGRFIFGVGMKSKMT